MLHGNHPLEGRVVAHPISDLEHMLVGRRDRAELSLAVTAVCIHPLTCVCTCGDGFHAAIHGGCVLEC